MAVVIPNLPPAWDALFRAVNNSPQRIGDPGVRDPDAPCDAFDPLPEGKYPNGRGDCMGDGHYLCRECSLLSAESERWPMMLCPQCRHGEHRRWCSLCEGTGEVPHPKFPRR